MKNIAKVMLTMLLLLNIIGINCYAEDYSSFKESLNTLGIKDEYSDNIVEYLEGLELSETKLNDLADNAGEIISIVAEKDSVDDFTIAEFYQIYSNGITITDDLNLGVDIDIDDKSFEIVDKGTENTLFKGDINDIKEIYSNYAASEYKISLDDISDLIVKDDLQSKDINEYAENAENINDYESNYDYEDNYINNDSNSEVTEETKQDDIERCISEIKLAESTNESSASISNKIFAVSAGAVLLIVLIKFLFFR